jgi:hypothetical protein
VSGSRASEDSEIYGDTFYIVEGIILLTLVHAKSREKLTDYDRKELLDKLPITPKTVDEAVVRMISNLDLKSKAKIANMDLDNFTRVPFELDVYFKNAFGVWHGNKELLVDCRVTSGEPIRDEDEASFVILKALWEKLRETHTLRDVK